MEIQFDPLASRLRFHEALQRFNSVIVGMEPVGRLMLSCFIQGAHFLGEGLPGSGKTRSVEVMARIIGGKHHIIQGNPDLKAKEISGSEYLDRTSNEWRIRWNALVEACLIMVDEINRMEPGTQSALLGPMSEGRISVQADSSAENATRYLQRVNVFMATQNPIEQEGTYPLPEAQQDRFLFKHIFAAQGDYDDEKFLLMNPQLGRRDILDTIEPVMSLDDIYATRLWVQENMRVSEQFVDYLLFVTRATHPGSKEFIAVYNQHKAIRPILNGIQSGISRRAKLALVEACKTRAFLFGVDEDKKRPRHFVMPEDFVAIAHDVMRHRILMTDRAAMRSNGRGDPDRDWSNDLPTDGTITPQQVVERLNRTGRNPITSEHVVDALLTHIDHTSDWAKFRQ